MVIYKVGETVSYQGCWGLDDPTQAVIIDLYVSDHEKDEDGDKASETLPVGYFVAFFDDGHWAYGYQVSKFTPELTIS